MRLFFLGGGGRVLAMGSRRFPLSSCRNAGIRQQRRESLLCALWDQSTCGTFLADWSAAGSTDPPVSGFGPLVDIYSCSAKDVPAIKIAFCLFDGRTHDTRFSEALGSSVSEPLFRHQTPPHHYSSVCKISNN